MAEVTASAEAACWDALRSRRVVAVARGRRARLLHRPVLPLAAPQVRSTAAADLHDWSGPVGRRELLARADQARHQSALLRRESHLLRDAVGWSARRLRRTNREVSCVATLHWRGPPKDFDDVIV